MSSIQMVDLRQQYLQIKSEIDSAIQSVIDSTSFIKGKEIGEFENDLASYLNCNHVVTCANGTDALQIALMALGLQPGDEVMTPSFTFVATAEVIALLQLKPVFIDVFPDTFTIDTSDLKRKITSKTKAIIPVHLFGQVADMEEIMTIATQHHLFVIEDNAQAIGANYTFKNGTIVKAGTIGHIGTTSFFPSKNLGCYGDGGALMTNSDEIASKLRLITNHGMKTRYQYDAIGINSRLDTIQAAILKVKLPYLEKYNNARQTAAKYYDTAFNACKNLSIPKRNPDSEHIFHQYTLLLEKEQNMEMVEFLKDKGIPAMVYYPIPIHVQKAYSQFGFANGSLPITENLCKRVFSIPMHTELTTEQQDIIIKAVLSFFQYN